MTSDQCEAMLKTLASNRQAALSLGLPKYIGQTCKCGSNVRYTSCFKCVECSGSRPNRHIEKAPKRASRIAKSRRHQPHYLALVGAKPI